MKPIVTVVFILFLSAIGMFAAESAAQPVAGASPESAAMLALDREYEAAFNKGDAAALAAFFAEDADHTTEDGVILRGRPEIEQSIRSGLQANKGATLAIHPSTVRVLAPEVAVEKGTSTVTRKDGESNTSTYTAIYVKKEGKWRISQLIEAAVPTESPRDRLEELAWLVGEWEETDKTNELTIESQYSWSRGGNFLARNVTVKRGDEPTLEGWQIIGWDAAQERIRSWTFDTMGGFSEGVWTRDGNRWLIRETGTVPDGHRTTADQTITKLSADKFTWEADNRTLNGEPQPSIGRVDINRPKGN